MTLPIRLQDDGATSLIAIAVTQNTIEKPFWKKNWAVITLLIVFAPAGIALTWLTAWPKLNKIAASGVSALWFLMLLAGSGAEEPKVQQSSPPTEQTEQAVVKPESELTPDVEREASSASENQPEMSAEALTIEPSTTLETELAEELEPVSESAIAEIEGEVTKASWDGEWPFSVDAGTLNCFRWNGQPAVTFNTEGTSYPLNSPAQAFASVAGSDGQVSSLEEIWLSDPDIPGGQAKISIGPFIEKGLAQCNE